MNDPQGNTTIIQGLLDRLSAGDEQARDDLLEHSMDRLRKLARAMLRNRPAVRRWNETDDVFQNALIRLHRALDTERPETTRRFIGLAATQIRRELIDLWRKYYGPQGIGKNHASDPGLQDSRGVARPMHDVEQKGIKTGVGEFSTQDMERFHVAVGQLPEKIREVFEKKFYLNMKHEEIADDIGVSTKTIKRRWRDAKLQLEELLQGGG